MDQRTRANELPQLYLEILASVVELERSPHARATATRIKRDAIHTYSAAWDDSHERHLRRLHAMVRRATAATRARSAQ